MRPSILNSLFADVTALPKIGPKLGALLGKVAGSRVIDVLLTPPVSLIDRSNRPKIAEARNGDRVTLLVTVDSHEPPPVRRRPYRVICSDATGFVTLIFFHAKADYLEKTLPVGASRLISGVIEEYGGGRQMTHPEYVVDPATPEALPLHEPVYPLTAGLSQPVFLRASRGALARAPDLPEWQDQAWLKKNDWPSWRDALNRLHNPTSDSDLSMTALARQRLAYDELLSNQLALALIRATRRRSRGRSFRGDGTLQKKAYAALPFELTGAQTRTLKEIADDMATQEQMIRLIQGDVGSGKTMVAFFAMLIAIEAGAQAALMAPTEILAQQHAASLQKLADAAGVTMVTITGRDKGQERAAKLSGVKLGYVDIAIGTHALFQEAVEFKNLGLVIVDEQHRVGVHQRLALAEKGARTDTLVMTATPIPRTLALTAYGDMDVSAIDEKPPGRKPVVTRIAPNTRLDEVIAAVRRTMDKNEQVYWVCPLVEESEVLALTAAQSRYDELREVFGDKVGLVHGKMASAEKDRIMEAFYRGALSVLIATTVIEVGVDAPNATVMVIEHAERFGLAQLHQLRGRVGRGGKPGACLLLYKPPLGETAKSRLKILRETEDGFVIAEEDLRLRGAGDLLGVAQSGLPQFRIADFTSHGELLKAAKDDVELILKADPKLESERGRALVTLLYLFSRDDAVNLLKAG